MVGKALSRPQKEALKRCLRDGHLMKEFLPGEVSFQVIRALFDRGLINNDEEITGDHAEYRLTEAGDEYARKLFA